MNRLIIIGNLTSDPELRTTQSGVSVCSFSVAVNRRSKTDKQETDFFRVNAWRELGENCHKYLLKGRKVAVVGSVSLNTYTNSKGENRANMEVMASEIEFLSPKQEENEAHPHIDPKSGMQQVETDELPF